MPAASEITGSESITDLQGGSAVRFSPAQQAAYSFGSAMPALIAAATGTGAEGVPMVKNGAPVLGAVNTTVAPNAQPPHYNKTPARLSKWRAALANAMAGVSSAKLHFWIDSLDAGAGAGAGLAVLPT